MNIKLIEMSNVLFISKVILYFGGTFFVGGFFNLLGRVDSLPDYLFLKLIIISAISTLVVLWIEYKFLPKVKENKNNL